MTISEEILEAAILKVLENFGAPEDLYHPDYGWILVDGKTTEAGKRWYKDQKEAK